MKTNYNNKLKVVKLPAKKALAHLQRKSINHLHPVIKEVYNSNTNTLYQITSWELNERRMSDQEWENELYFFNWCQKNRYTNNRNANLYQAFEIFHDELYELFTEKMMEREDQKHFKSLLNKLRVWKESVTEKTLPDGTKVLVREDLDIEKAKQYCIFSLAESLGYRIRQNKIKSIFNPSERTPSLHLFRDTNSYFDFSQNRGGDVIDFLMNASQIDFRQAVRQLTQ